MRTYFNSLLPLLLLLALGRAHADDGGGLIALPKPSQIDCMTPTTAGDKLPVYPERELTLKQGAVVRVRLTFVRPDAAPTADVFFNSGTDAFSDLVAGYVKSYRLPCMAASAAPLIATQEFEFVPGDGRKVIFGGLQGESRVNHVVECLIGNEGRPKYPQPFGRSMPQGSVIVSLNFTDASQPPQAKILFDGGSTLLARAVLDYVERYRLPCLGTSDAPLKTLQTFAFRLGDSTQYMLNDLSLKQFVGAIDKLEQQHVRFDFSTMSCPFDVRLRLLQPYAGNLVGEVERADPNRRGFVEWLKGVALRLPSGMARQVIGQALTISVPCGVLDLS